MDNDIDWTKLTHEEKNLQLFLKQKEMLENFLRNGAITKRQFDKSYGDLKLKMNIK